MITVHKPAAICILSLLLLFFYDTYGEYGAGGNYGYGKSGKTKTVRTAEKEGGEQIVPVLQSTHSRRIYCIAFSPDSKIFITGSNDNTVRLWNINGKLIKRIGGFSGNIVEVIFSPDGKSFLTLGGSSEKQRELDNELKLWRIDGRMIANLAGHKEGIANAYFSADGNTILSFSRKEKTIRLWGRDGRLIRTLAANKSFVRSAGLSPNGEFVVATTYRDNNAYVWNINGRLVATLKGHNSFVLRVAFSPAGRYIATGSSDKTVRLWDYSGNCIRTFKGYAFDDHYQEYDPFFSPDGSYIISRADDENELRLWSVDGKITRAFNFEERGKKPEPREKSIWDEVEEEENPHLKARREKKIFKFTLSPDGRLVIALAKGGKIIIWDSDGRLINILSGKISNWNISVSSDNRHIASLGVPAGIEERVLGLCLWDIKDKKERILQAKSHSDYSDVAFSPDGRYIVSYDERKVSLWNNRGRLLHALGEEVIGKFALHLSSDKRRFLSYEATDIIGNYFKIRHWGINGRLINTLDRSNTSFAGGVSHQCVPSHDLGYMLSIWYRRAVLYNMEEKGEKILERSVGTVRDNSFDNMSPDGRYILTVNDERDVMRLWSIEGALICTLEGNAGRGLFTGFSPDGRYIVRVTEKNIRLWRDDGKLILKIGEPITTFPIPASFSPDGRFIALGLKKGLIRIYSTEGKLVRSFKSHRSSMVVFTPVGNLILSAGTEDKGEGALRLYNSKGRPIEILQRGIRKESLGWHWKYGHGFLRARHSLDGRKFIICYGNRIQMWSGEGKKIKTVDLSGPLSPGYGVLRMECNRKGIYIAARAALEHTIKVLLYDWTFALKKVHLLRGHSSYIADAGIVMDLDRQLLMTCSSDGTIKYWSLDTGECIATLIGFRENAGIIYTPDYYYRLSGDAVKAVAFVKGKKAYSFEQFDLIYNRPDIVLERIYPQKNRPRSVQEEIDRYRRYWLYRIRQNGFTEKQVSGQVKMHAPEVFDIKINNIPLDAAETTVRDKSITLSFAIRDERGSDKNVIGYKIFVNGVPLHGQYVKRFDKPRLVQRISETITLSSVPDIGSSPGDNKIEISGFTEDGIESNREALFLHLDSKDEIKGNLYIVSIGIDNYSASKGFESLAYAVRDARDIVTAFSTASRERYNDIFAMLYTDKEVSRTAIKEIRKKLSRTTVNDTIIFFMSGHGIRADTPPAESKKITDYFGMPHAIGDVGLSRGRVNIYYYMTGDSDADRPWLTGIPMDAIRLALDGIPARQKLLLIDTCQSGENPLLTGYVPSKERLEEVRKKRGSLGKKDSQRGIRLVRRGRANERGIMITAAWALDMREMSEMFPELRRGTGTIEISAANGVQSALESEEWNNGAFTYVIKEAILKGKAKDEHGRITARSLRKYVLEQVEVLTGGDQTPMVCRDIAGRDFEIFGR